MKPYVKKQAIKKEHSHDFIIFIFSLSVLCTDAPASLEIELRKLLSQKLSRNAVYFDAGSVTQFDVGLGYINIFIIFHVLINELSF